MECDHSPCATQASSCSDRHCHGQAPQNAWKRRSTRTRATVMAGLRRRAVCCRRQPSIIASNNAGSGRSSIAPSTSTSAADPAMRPAIVHVPPP
ncbi:MAG: hypothetical protein ACRD0D_02900 [Acidimicrobiales bacterium]